MKKKDTMTGIERVKAVVAGRAYDQPPAIIKEAAAARCYSVLGVRSMVRPGCEVSPCSPVASVHALVEFSRQRGQA